MKFAGDEKMKIGLRMAIDEESQSSYYTSRLGIRNNAMVDFCKNHIMGNEKIELKMLHFFVDSGIKDTWRYNRPSQNPFCSSNTQSEYKKTFVGFRHVRENESFQRVPALTLEEQPNVLKADVSCRGVFRSCYGIRSGNQWRLPGTG